jgi:6,7-dimethyl-8-ribityllumazine synthase
MLQVKKPIGFGVLTTENEEQALARAGGVHGNKGADAASVVVEMIGLLKDLREAKLTTPPTKKTKIVSKSTKNKKRKK